MTHLTLFNPSFQRLFANPFFDLPARFAPAQLDEARLDQAQFGEPAGGRTNGATLWRPPVDVRESDTEVVVEAELPGIAREDIAVRYHDGRLILEGQRKDVREAGPEVPRPVTRTARRPGSGANGWPAGSTAPSICPRAWTVPPSGRRPRTAC